MTEPRDFDLSKDALRDQLFDAPEAGWVGRSEDSLAAWNGEAGKPPREGETCRMMPLSSSQRR